MATLNLEDLHENEDLAYSDFCIRCGKPYPPNDKFPDRAGVLTVEKIKFILHQAIENDDSDQIEELLNMGVSPEIEIKEYDRNNMPVGDNRSIIFRVLEGGCLRKKVAWKVLYLLLQRCVRLPDLSYMESSAIAIIVNHGDLNLIRYLFEEYCHRRDIIKDFNGPNINYDYPYELQLFILRQPIIKERFEILEYLVNNFHPREEVMVKLVGGMINQFSSGKYFGYNRYRMVSFLISKIPHFELKHPFLNNDFKKMITFLSQ